MALSQATFALRPGLASGLLVTWSAMYSEPATLNMASLLKFPWELFGSRIRNQTLVSTSQVPEKVKGWINS